MLTTSEITAYATAIGGFLAGPAVALWGLYKWRAERQDTARREAATRGQTEADAIVRNWKDVAAHAAARIVELERDRDKRELVRDQIEADRDRGWDLARYYYAALQDVYGELRQAQQIADSILRGDYKGAGPAWRPIPALQFEAPIVRPARAPGGDLTA